MRATHHDGEPARKVGECNPCGRATRGSRRCLEPKLFVARLLTSFLYGVEPNDPATLLMVGAVFVLVSATACLAPARRATAVDPVRVLKAE